MTFNDDELEAMNNIAGVLKTLDEQARFRVLQWIGDRYYNTSSSHSRASSASGADEAALELSADSPTATIPASAPIRDFIHLTVGDDGFKQLGHKEKILLIMKYITASSGEKVVPKSRIREIAHESGYITGRSLYTYILRLKKDDGFIYPLDGGWALTMKGEEQISNILGASGGNALKENHVHPAPFSQAKTSSTSQPKTTKIKRGKKPPTVSHDQEFLRVLDSGNGKINFADFLDELDTDTHKSAAAFICFSVCYICDVLEKEDATLSEIATCFKSARRIPPDYFRQAVIDTANKNGYIFYASEIASPANAGRKLLEKAKKAAKDSADDPGGERE